jgi:pyruvate/2-oxoglutarate dehydrogenase complex dihydrolipoamide acyltransferase (E2) component
LEIQSLPNTVETLPITNPASFLTLHYTQPQHDVVIDSPSSEERYFDISTIGDKPLSYDVKLKTSQRVKLSLAFDASRVDEVQAIQFLQRVQTYLNDPAAMLL